MIATQRKRDRRLQMVYVAKEQARISREQTGVANKQYEQQKKNYEVWCKENNVETLLED